MSLIKLTTCVLLLSASCISLPGSGLVPTVSVEPQPSKEVAPVQVPDQSVEPTQEVATTPVQSSPVQNAEPIGKDAAPIGKDEAPIGADTAPIGKDSAEPAADTIGKDDGAPALATESDPAPSGTDVSLGLDTYPDAYSPGADGNGTTLDGTLGNDTLGNDTLGNSTTDGDNAATTDLPANDGTLPADKSTTGKLDASTSGSVSSLVVSFGSVLAAAIITFM